MSDEAATPARRLRTAFAAVFCVTIAAFIATAVASLFHADAVSSALLIAGIGGAVVTVALFVAAQLVESRIARARERGEADAPANAPSDHQGDA